MTKKKPGKPGELPKPGTEPEIKPETVPDNPVPPGEEPEIIPDTEPGEPSLPVEIPLPENK